MTQEGFVTYFPSTNYYATTKKPQNPNNSSDKESTMLQHNPLVLRSKLTNPMVPPLVDDKFLDELVALAVNVMGGLQREDISKISDILMESIITSLGDCVVEEDSNILTHCNEVSRPEEYKGEFSLDVAMSAIEEFDATQYGMKDDVSEFLIDGTEVGVDKVDNVIITEVGRSTMPDHLGIDRSCSVGQRSKDMGFPNCLEIKPMASSRFQEDQLEVEMHETVYRTQVEMFDAKQYGMDTYEVFVSGLEDLLVEDLGKTEFVDHRMDISKTPVTLQATVSHSATEECHAVWPYTSLHTNTAAEFKTRQLMDEAEVLELGLRGGDGDPVEGSVTHSWIINERVRFTDGNNSIRLEEELGMENLSGEDLVEDMRGDTSEMYEILQATFIKPTSEGQTEWSCSSSYKVGAAVHEAGLLFMDEVDVVVEVHDKEEEKIVVANQGKELGAVDAEQRAAIFEDQILTSANYLHHRNNFHDGNTEEAKCRFLLDKSTHFIMGDKAGTKFVAMEGENKLKVSVGKKPDHMVRNIADCNVTVADIRPNLIPDQPKLFNKSCKSRNKFGWWCILILMFLANITTKLSNYEDSVFGVQNRSDVVRSRHLNTNGFFTDLEGETENSTLGVDGRRWNQMYGHSHKDLSRKQFPLAEGNVMGNWNVSRFPNQMDSGMEMGQLTASDGGGLDQANIIVKTGLESEPCTVYEELYLGDMKEERCIGVMGRELLPGNKTLAMGESLDIYEELSGKWVFLGEKEYRSKAGISNLEEEMNRVGEKHYESDPTCLEEEGERKLQLRSSFNHEDAVAFGKVSGNMVNGFDLYQDNHIGLVEEMSYEEVACLWSGAADNPFSQTEGEGEMIFEAPIEEIGADVNKIASMVVVEHEAGSQDSSSNEVLAGTVADVQEHPCYQVTYTKTLVRRRYCTHCLLKVGHRYWPSSTAKNNQTVLEEDVFFQALFLITLLGCFLPQLRCGEDDPNELFVDEGQVNSRGGISYIKEEVMGQKDSKARERKISEASSEYVADEGPEIGHPAAMGSEAEAKERQHADTTFYTVEVQRMQRILLPDIGRNRAEVEYDSIRAEHVAAREGLRLACKKAIWELSVSFIEEERKRTIIRELDRLVQHFISAFCDHEVYHSGLVGQGLPDKEEEKFWVLNEIAEEVKDVLRGYSSISSLTVFSLGQSMNVDNITFHKWPDILMESPSEACKKSSWISSMQQKPSHSSPDSSPTSSPSPGSLQTSPVSSGMPPTFPRSPSSCSAVPGMTSSGSTRPGLRESSLPGWMWPPSSCPVKGMDQVSPTLRSLPVQSFSKG